MGAKDQNRSARKISFKNMEAQDDPDTDTDPDADRS